MPYSGHSEFENHIASGLSICCNALISTVGNGTYQAASTNVATWQAANNVQEATPAIHETDKALFQSANRYCQNINAMGIYTDAEIAASNTTPTWRAAFTADDANLPADYISGHNRG